MLKCAFFVSLSFSFSMHLFFQEKIELPITYLAEEESRHLVKVLRKKQGDQVRLTNGNGKVFDCVILEASLKKTSLKVLTSTAIPEDNFQIHLAIAPTKSPDRMEWMVEKITITSRKKAQK